MKKRTRESTAPDITPLIDVVFLLLIFFMVSTVFKKDELSLLLNLPKTQQGQATNNQKEITVIELSEKEVSFNGKKLDFNELDLYLQKISDKQKPIDLRIDKKVRYERVVKIFDNLNKYGLSNLSLITQEKK